MLSLSQNQFGDIGGMAIAELIEVNATYIREIRLNWNCITGKGGNGIAEALRHNNQLRVLFLAWNSIGQGLHVGKAWSHAFTENKFLLHLDLSHNKIMFLDT